MRKDTIEIGGKTYRVEINWNSITAYLEASGKDDINSLVNFGQLRPSDLAGLLAADINEGERLEGREVSFSALEIGALCDVSTMGKFMVIFSNQTSPKGQEQDEKKKV